MPLLPSNPDETENDEDTSFTLTGIEVTSGDREQILEALKLNRQMLYEPQPDAEVDEGLVRRAIDALLDQLNDAS